MYHYKNPKIVQYYGRDRYVEGHNNYFNEYTFADHPMPNNYSYDQYAVWEGPRHRQDMAEYNRSTQNGQYCRAETQDELENRIMTPGYRNYWDEITPERLAEDPGDAIVKYYDGWVKNTSDFNVNLNMARVRQRQARKGNYRRVYNQVNRYVIMSNNQANGWQYAEY